MVKRKLHSCQQPGQQVYWSRNDCDDIIKASHLTIVTSS